MRSQTRAGYPSRSMGHPSYATEEMRIDCTITPPHTAPHAATRVTTVPQATRIGAHRITTRIGLTFTSPHTTRTPGTTHAAGACQEAARPAVRATHSSGVSWTTVAAQLQSMKRWWPCGFATRRVRKSSGPRRAAAKRTTANPRHRAVRAGARLRPPGRSHRPPVATGRSAPPCIAAQRHAHSAACCSGMPHRSATCRPGAWCSHRPWPQGRRSADAGMDGEVTSVQRGGGDVRAVAARGDTACTRVAWHGAPPRRR